MFFAQRTYGWSESAWFNGISNDLNSYFGQIDALAQKRIKLCGITTTLPFVRWSQEGVFRDVALWGYPGGGLPGTAAKDSDAPSTALLLALRNGLATRHRNIYLRGIWDEGVVTGGVYTPSVAYVALMNDYLAQLVAGGWGWLGNNTTTESILTNVVQNVNGTVDLTAAAAVLPGPFPQEATIRVSGVLGASQVNGVQIVRASSATQFNTKKRISIFPYQAGGKARYSTKDLILIAGGTVRRVVERKPGRPSYQSRGRRRALAAS
jgi:hypothetical protein